MLVAGLFLNTCTTGGDGGTQELRLGVVQPGSFDPVRAGDTASALIARQVFGMLVTFDPRTNRARPGAATWQVHDGGTRFVFSLKRGTKFHNGRAVTAADAVFSLNRLAQKATASDLSFLLEHVVGFDSVNKLGTAGELEGVRALDESTIEIRLSTPWIDFPYVLTHPATAPIPRDEFLADPEAFKSKPLGSGAYAFAAPIAPGGNVRLEAIEKSRTKGPAIKRATFLVYPQVSAAFRDFERGSVDFAEVPAGGPRSLAGYRGTAGFAPIAAMLHVAFNLRSPKLADIRFREAISVALDIDSLRQSIYSGILLPEAGLIPRGLPGRGATACGSRCELDLPRAKRLVSEVFAGQAPPEIFYDFPEGERDRAAAEAIRENLGAIGVPVGLRGHDLPAYVELLRAGGQDMFRLGWVAEFPHPDWFISPLFRTGAPDNTFGYSVAQVDELIARVRLEQEQSQKDRLYGELEARIMADMPVAPLGQFQSHYAVRDLRGFYVDVLGTFDLKDMDASSG